MNIQFYYCNHISNIMKLSVKNDKQYRIFLVFFFVHLYISNPYVIEAKVFSNKAAVFIYDWWVLRVFHYGGTGRIIQKMTKYLPIRVLFSTKFLFLPHKSPPYCYLKWDATKWITIEQYRLANHTKIFSSSFIFQVLQMLLDFQYILHIKHTNNHNYQQLQEAKFDCGLFL